MAVVDIEQTAADDPPITKAAKKRPKSQVRLWDHVVLLLGVFFMMGPIVVAFTTSSFDFVTIHREGMQLGWGDNFVETYKNVIYQEGGFTGEVTGLLMTQNSLILGIGFAVGKIVVSMLAAYAIVYFRFPLATFSFWVIFTTLLLPLEVRILPSYEVVQQLGMLNTYSGLIIPLIASATGTFFFRQFFKSIPNELMEAARIDGANAWRFFVDILVPLSKTMMAAIFIIMFVVGWNQYLWPALMTTEEGYFTLVRGIRNIMQQMIGADIPEYNEALAMAMLAMLPPALVIIIFQRMFIKGLVEQEK